MVENFNSLPDVMNKLTDDERYLINKHFSIAYLSGKIQIPIVGTASPHLQSTFHLTMRKENTSFMLIDQNIPQISEVEDKMKEVFEWLKNHNHLYSNLMNQVYYLYLMQLLKQILHHNQLFCKNRKKKEKTN